MLLDLLSLEYGHSVTTGGDTHDLPRKATEGYKKHLKKQRALAEKRQAEKLLEAQELRAQIEQAKSPQPEPEIVSEAAFEIGLPVDNLPALLMKLAELEQHVMALERERQNQNTQLQILQDEEDMEIILEMLSAPLRQFK